jgi:membrane carboxypeptidase/penicillin-binding protein PbpC
VVGVWVGNADGQPMEAISGVSGAGPVWHDVMLAAHRGLPPRPFARPDGILELTVCAEGGMLPTPSCPATRRERFIAGSEPRQPDNTHVAVAVDPALGCRAPAGYPIDRVTTRVFRILPPEADGWMIAAGLPRVPGKICPTLASVDQPLSVTGGAALPVADGSSAGVAPALLAPVPGAVFAVSPGVPRERQQIQLTARAGPDAAQLTIYVDDQPLVAFDKPPYRAFWPLVPGPHRAMVEATDEHGKIWRSSVIEFVVEAK